MSDRVDTNIISGWTKHVEIPSKKRPTPRVDRVVCDPGAEREYYVEADFARALEREADELREALQQLDKLLAEKEYSKTGEMRSIIAALNTEPKKS